MFFLEVALLLKAKIETYGLNYKRKVRGDKRKIFEVSENLTVLKRSVCVWSTQCVEKHMKFQALKGLKNTRDFEKYKKLQIRRNPNIHYQAIIEFGRTARVFLNKEKETRVKTTFILPLHLLFNVLSLLRQYANNKCCLFIAPRFDWMKSSMSWCVKFASCGLGTMAVEKNAYEQSNTAYERGRNNYFPLAKFVLNDDSLSYSLSFIFIHLLHK